MGLLLQLVTLLLLVLDPHSLAAGLHALPVLGQVHFEDFVVALEAQHLDR